MGKRATSGVVALALAGCLPSADDYEDLRQDLMDLDGDLYPAAQYVGLYERGYPVADCDDRDFDVNPGADEVWYDDVDNDCDPATADDDQDGDGFDAEDQGGTDCNDEDPDQFPENEEIYYDGQEQDCDESSSDMDQDGDGYEILIHDDCDDTRADIYPGADEVCDLVDTDCDGEIDEGVDTWWVDADGDGYGSDELGPTVSCTPDSGAVYVDGDCDDGEAGVSPRAEEVCNDLVDNDCDGTDNGCSHPAEVVLEDQELRLESTSAGDLFGACLAVADLDRDGRDDLIVGAAGDDEGGADAGIARAYLSPVDFSGGLAGADWYYLGEPGLQAARFITVLEDLKGTTVAFGSGGDGVYYLFSEFGAEGSDPSSSDAQLFDAPDTPAPGADLNLDGRADLILSNPRFETPSPETGGAQVFYGPLNGTLHTSDASISIQASDSDDLFGSAALVEDFNGDGLPELFVAAVEHSGTATQAGAVLMFGNPEEQTIDTDADLVWTGFETGMRAGEKLNSADLDSDGYPDLIVTAPFADAAGVRSAGVILIVPGTPNPNSTTMATSGLVLSGEEESGYLGVSAASAGDFNGDGHLDLAAGAPGAERGGLAAAGTVFVFTGPITTDLGTANATLEAVGSIGEETAGFHIVTAHLDGDALPDLAIGAPYYLSSSGPGTVTVLPGAGF